MDAAMMVMALSAAARMTSGTGLLTKSASEIVPSWVSLNTRIAMLDWQQPTWALGTY